MQEKKNTMNQCNTNVETLNVENVMKAAEILENKYEMLYEDLSENDTTESEK